MQNRGRVHKNLLSVCEAQNHKCASCHDRFPDNLSDYLKKSISLVRLIEDGLMRDYHNSVAICSKCRGMCSKQGTIWQVSAHLRNTPPSAPPERNASNFEVFSRLVTNAGFPELVIIQGHGKPRRDIELAPSDRIPEITASIIDRHIRIKAHPRILAYRYTKTNSNKRKRTWKRLFEEQQGLCYYDDYPMSANPKKRDAPRGATFEHLVRRADGGSDLIENLALACKVCNSLRGKLHMGVEEFREWARTNPHEIEYIVQHGYRPWANLNTHRIGDNDVLMVDKAGLPNYSRSHVADQTQ